LSSSACHSIWRHPRSRSFASIRIHSRFGIFLQSVGAAGPHQCKMQDGKNQETRKTAKACSRFGQELAQRVTWPEGSNARVARGSQKRWARCPRLLEDAGGTPALPFEDAADHSRGPLWTKVPAYLSSTIFLIRIHSWFEIFLQRVGAAGRIVLPGLRGELVPKFHIF